MNLINSIIRYIYGLSIVEYAVLILFTTWAYLKIKGYISKKSEKVWKILNSVCLILFTLLVVYRVLLNRAPGSVVSKVEFIPFLSYIEYFRGNNPEAFITNRANILLFFPFGLLLFEFLKTKKRVIIYLIIAFAFSFALEALQYVFSLGVAQIDDIIHNTMGAFIGYLIPWCCLNSSINKRIFEKLKLKD